LDIEFDIFSLSDIYLNYKRSVKTLNTAVSLTMRINKVT